MTATKAKSRRQQHKPGWRPTRRANVKIRDFHSYSVLCLFFHLPVRIQRRFRTLRWKISHAKVLDRKLSVIPLRSVYCNDTSWTEKSLNSAGVTRAKFNLEEIYDFINQFFLHWHSSPVTHLSRSILPSSLILWSSSSRTSSSVSLMYLDRAGWGSRLCWRRQEFSLFHKCTESLVTVRISYSTWSFLLSKSIVRIDAI